jgi:hypothetical protein
MTTKTWDGRNFQRLFKYSPRQAFEYRKTMLWDEIPYEYMTDEEKKEVELKDNSDKWGLSTSEEVSDINKAEVEKELSRDEIKAILEKNNIEFAKNAKTEFLKKKLIENNLL